MTDAYLGERDVIVRTPAWREACKFYASVLRLPLVMESATMAGFEAGSFRLYVESGPAHGPVFEFLVADVGAAKRELLAAGCVLLEEDAALPRCYLRDPYGLAFNLRRAT